MAFFCTKSGVRIVAPGISVDAGGNVPNFVSGDRESEWAEEAAQAVLKAAAPRPPPGASTSGPPAPSPDVIERARLAAIREMGPPKEKRLDVLPEAEEAEEPPEKAPAKPPAAEPKQPPKKG